jgi:hypothetical protein
MGRPPHAFFCSFSITPGPNSSKLKWETPDTCPQIVLAFRRVSIKTAKVAFRPPHDWSHAAKKGEGNFFITLPFYFLFSIAMVQNLRAYVSCPLCKFERNSSRIAKVLRKKRMGRPPHGADGEASPCVFSPVSFLIPAATDLCHAPYAEGSAPQLHCASGLLVMRYIRASAEGKGMRVLSCDHWKVRSARVGSAVRKAMQRRFDRLANALSLFNPGCVRPFAVACLCFCSA